MKPIAQFRRARDQEGASLWLVLLFVIVLGFAAVFGLKLIPVYLEWWKVQRAVEGAMQAGVESASRREIKAAIIRRLNIDEVRRITEVTFDEFMTIDKRGNRVTVEINYDRVEPLFGNLSILAHFEKSITR